jgi:hypothetical protein
MVGALDILLCAMDDDDADTDADADDASLDVIPTYRPKFDDDKASPNAEIERRVW